MINDVAGRPSAFVTNDCITDSVKYHDSSKLVCSGRAFNTKIQHTQMEGKLKGKKKKQWHCLMLWFLKWPLKPQKLSLNGYILQS